MERKNYYAIDIAKFISALLVICIHTGPLMDINSEANFVLVQIIARIAVPLFFIISGFLFFEKIDLRREWNDYENIKILKYYVARLCKIYIIWTILYLPFTYVLFRAQGGITMMGIAGYIRDFFFTGSYYHLWFLPALIFAVCAVYFLCAAIQLKKTLIITLILYLIGMMGNVYPQLLQSIPGVNTIFQGYSDIFVTTRNGLFFGMIYIAIGAYFSKKPNYLKKSAILTGFIVSLCLLFGECFFIRRAGYMHDLASMYLMLIPCVSFLFLFLIKVQLQPNKIYKLLRKLSLLIYVSHIMFVTVLIWTMPQLNSFIGYLISLFASLIFSIVLVALSKKLTFLKVLY